MSLSWVFHTTFNLTWWYSVFSLSFDRWLNNISPVKELDIVIAGTKVFVVSEPGTLHMEYLLKYVYELYTDYVLKNPFYEMEMPIRCELFDINLTQAVQKDRVALLGRWTSEAHMTHVVSLWFCKFFRISSIRYMCNVCFFIVLE